MKNNVVVLKSALTTFAIMLCFEALKELFLKGVLTSWQSHSITIVFTTLMSIIITLFTINQISLIKEKSLEIQLKQEKLKSIRQVIYVAKHHLNNLSNNLNIIQLEIEDHGQLNNKTIDSLNLAIESSSVALKRLDDIDNPFDSDWFKLEL